MVTKTRLLHDTIIIPSGSVATTQSATDNTTKVATTAYVTTAIANLSDSAPSTLNTLNELAAALGDDANFSTTVTNSIAAKLPLSGGTLTGHLKGTTFGTNLTTTVGVGGTPADSNTAEVGPGYINLARDDTANAKQILFGKNGAVHSFLETTSSGLNIGGANVGIGTSSPSRNLSVLSDSFYSLELQGTNAYNNLVDTGIVFSAKYNSGNAVTDIASIRGGRFSTSDGNYAGVLKFFTRPNGGSDTERMRISYDGNVGIGTASPSSTLHIEPSNSDTLATAIFTRQSNAAGSDNNTFSLRNDAANNFVEMNSGGTNNGGYKFYISNFSGDPALTIVGAGSNSGNVGIGTETPAHKLVVSENSSGLAANFLNSNTSGAGVNIAAASGDTNYAFRVEDYAGNEKFRINGSGKVGIGESSPDKQLHIKNAATGDTGIVIENTNNAQNLDIDFYNNTGSAQGRLRYAEGAGSFELNPNVSGASPFTILYNGNIGVGVASPGYKLCVSSKLVVGDSPGVGLSGNTIHVRENSSSGIHFPLVVGGGTHVAGAAFGIGLDPEGYGNRNKIAILAEGIGAGYSRGRLHFAIDNVSDSGQVALADSKMCITESGNIGIGAQVDNPSGTLDIRGGRAGIISTDSSWGQFRVANSGLNEVGITVMNGCTATEYLSDGAPSSSNKFIMGISPYGSGTDTWGIGHGALGDSVMHIDGSGNFGFGVNTDNPLTFFEISKSRPNVNQPSDYELKMTLNTYGYVGSNYKLGMIQFVGGDTASAQDNFYAGMSARAVNGANHQEDGALQFHVRSDQDTDTLAVEINGEHNTGSQIAGSGSTRNGMLFRWQGIAIDRSWGNYPGIAVFNSSDYSTSQSAHSEFRVHGTNGASSTYPSSSGSDFSVNFRVDGSYLTGSDLRRKTNITTIPSALSTVNQLTGKRFQTVNRSGEINKYQSKADNYKFGFIAQDVEDIIPEAVKYHADEDDGTEDWNSAYSIDYASLTALLVNAIKEQDTVIQDLKTRIETLEG